MANFKCTNKAVEDLSNIWNYTFEVWSERQADIYYDSIIFDCQKIADDPHLGKHYNEITQNLLGTKSNRHIIFYRILNDNDAETTRILHESMDLKKRVTE